MWAVRVAGGGGGFPTEQRLLIAAWTNAGRAQLAPDRAETEAD